MLLSKRGSMHTFMFALIILFGFGLALGLPQYQKHKNISEGRTALNRGGALAQAAYKQAHGSYTQDFSRLDLPEELAYCTLQEAGKALLCGEYLFTQEGGVLKASHVRFPKWLEFYLDEGRVDCAHAGDSDAGRHICEGINASFPIKI